MPLEIIFEPDNINGYSFSGNYSLEIRHGVYIKNNLKKTIENVTVTKEAILIGDISKFLYIGEEERDGKCFFAKTGTSSCNIEYDKPELVNISKRELAPNGLYGDFPHPSILKKVTAQAEGFLPTIKIFNIKLKDDKHQLLYGNLATGN